MEQPPIGQLPVKPPLPRGGRERPAATVRESAREAYVVAVAVGGGLCFLGVLVAATVALFFGRELRAEGSAQLGKDRGIDVRVDMPGKPEKARSAELEP